MRYRQIWQTSLALIRQHPYMWLIALLAGLGDLGAVLAYDPFSTRLSMGILLLALFTLLAEAALIYAMSQHLTGKGSSFLDGLLVSATSLVYILIVKVLPMLLLAIVAVFTLLFHSVILGVLDWLGNPAVNFVLAALLASSGMVLLVWTQVWTVFALRIILAGNATDFFSESWEALWTHKRQLAMLVIPFVLADLILLSILWTFDGITRESILEYTVTEEQAAAGSTVGEVESAGAETSINRILNAFMTTTLKGRGPDLASLSLLVIDRAAVGIAVVLLGLLILPLRIGVLVIAAVSIAHPDQPITVAA